MTIDIEYQDRPVFFGGGSDPKWLKGQLTSTANGSSGDFVVKLPNGRILSVQPNGSYQDREPQAAGPWELCSVDPTINVLRFTKTVAAYAIAYRAA
jgi:hypothetical protein